MILFRYLARQLLQVTAAVTLILLVVSFTSRFLQYLGDAVAGQMTTDILLLLMSFRLPEFLTIIVPFAWFLAVLLTYGRMYAENELVVLHACGYSRRRLLGVTTLIALILATLMGLLSLYAAPAGLQQTERLRQSQQELTEIDLIVAGQFQEFNRGQRVTYAETISETGQGRQLNNTFVVVRDPTPPEGESGLRVMIAETARPVLDEPSGRRFMLLENGVFYDGTPGQADYTITDFVQQGILLPEQVGIAPVLEEKALPTLALLGSADPAYQAELQWRISVVLLLPILSLIAVPLSKVEPRQGRFARLVPAALLYGVYFMLLQVSRDAIEEGELPVLVGLWWVHLMFLAGGLWLMLRGRPRVSQASRLASGPEGQPS
ncbi:LPS export ABC transporter permease LptF [Pseudohongiella sp. O18]|mgnify:FL=1|uniref:LPS export ABC transporter permease LptF n=1 Tax=Pseudohongiella sp. O18 TaxID=2904248 RepID=UPI001F030C89|nr:LPS export ABC transporter permease LptF [Pseudohongiella sp. O18]